MLSKIFSRALILCIALGIFSMSVLGQNADGRSRRTKETEETGEPVYAEDDPVIISVASNIAPSEEMKPNSSFTLRTAVPLMRFQPLLVGAIDARLGSPYRWGSTGPYSFDCSGFVWSTFHTAGIDFERGSARTLWARFDAPPPDEQFKFGTLVFFNGQKHVGIVADENGFYHASRHHGVVYATFAGYWGKHVDGFRRVPLPVQPQQTDE
jgi:cell wall-associated NlpC family hydrolase